MAPLLAILALLFAQPGMAVRVSTKRRRSPCVLRPQSRHPEDVAGLYGRIRAAAIDVCKQSEGSPAHQTGCIGSASPTRCEAVKDVHNEKLSALSLGTDSRLEHRLGGETAFPATFCRIRLTVEVMARETPTLARAETTWILGAGSEHQAFSALRGARQGSSCREDLVNETSAQESNTAGLDIGFAADRGSVAQFGGHLFDHLGDLASSVHVRSGFPAAGCARAR